MKTLSTLSLLAVSVSLTACAPIYKPLDMRQTVTLNSKPDTYLRICKKNEWYRLEKDNKGLVRIPYGKRIGVGVNYFNSDSDGYMTTTETCFPTLSFIPKKGNRYYIDFYIGKKNCHVEVMRYTDNSKLGFTSEESASKEPACLP